MSLLLSEAAILRVVASLVAAERATIGTGRAWDCANWTAATSLGPEGLALDSLEMMAASEVVEPEQWARTKEILREALQTQKRTCKRESEIERLSREIQLTEKKARAAEEMAYDAEGSERERHRASLRSHLAQLDLLKRALAEVARQPALEDPDDILAAAEAHVVHLREQLARGGLEAAPAVRAVMGQEKFLATRQADGTWALTADVSTAFLFEGLGTNQKAAITGASAPATTTAATTPAVVPAGTATGTATHS